MDAFIQDLRYTLRSLRRSPGFALLALLTLGLGVGATTAIFRLVDAALLQPLPYHDPGRLVVLNSTQAEREISMSIPDLLDLRTRTRALQALSGFAGSSFNLTGRGEAERLAGQMVTADLFRTLGVDPALGRGFLPEEERPGGRRVVVLSNGLWRRHYESDPEVVGGAITLNGEPFTVIGVMPPGFDFPGGVVYGAADVWVPLGMLQGEWDDRDQHPGVYGVGRLAPGVSVEDATRELGGIAAQLESEHPDTNEQTGVALAGALETLVGNSGPTLLFLLAAVGLVLLLACVNVASLLLARATSRNREMAMRAALGAAPARITRQLLVEGLVLATLGGFVGLLMAIGAGRATAPLLVGIPRLENVSLSGRVLMLALLVVAATAVLFGLVPAFASLRSDLAHRLRERAEGSGGGRSRALLSGAQVALAVALLVGAAILVDGYTRANRVDIGVQPDGVFTFVTSLPTTTYGDAEEPVARFYDELYRGLEALPGVNAVGGISLLPLSGGGAQSGISIPGTGIEPISTDVASVTPGYLDAMGMRLVRGRWFTESDGPDVPVAVVDERFAARFWPGEDPLGKHVEGWSFRELTVVGVVAHVKNYGATAESREELFVPHALRSSNRIFTVIRTSGDPAALAPSIRRIVAELDPGLPVYSMRTMREVVDATVSAPRLAAALTGAFATLALMLALVGVYGITAFAVARRRHEIGIRLALGASPVQIFRLILRQALLPAFLGAGAGVIGAFAASRLLASQIYGLSEADPALFLAVPLALLVTVALASSVPARAAARLDPLDLVRT
jgi:putative ABC transport system permease protein